MQCPRLKPMTCFPYKPTCPRTRERNFCFYRRSCVVRPTRLQRIGSGPSRHGSAKTRIRRSLCRCPKRSEEHTSELQSLMRRSYAVFCLKTKKKYNKLKQDNMKIRT